MNKLRRSLIAGAGLATVALPLLAQEMQKYLPTGMAAKPKGPRVFLDYDKEEINLAYDQAPWAPNADEIAKRNAQKTAATVARLGAPRRLAYGPTEIEKLDLYAAKQSGAPINVFVHGGAWRRGDAKSAGYMAETYVDAGAHFIALDFASVADVDGNLLVMADQVRRAVAWVHQNAASIGGDPKRLYISGTSSGG